jgi:hypothetical protein
MYTTPGFTDEKIHLFMATGLSGETKHEADEFLDLEPMLLSKALEMVDPERSRMPRPRSVSSSPRGFAQAVNPSGQIGV